MPISPSTGGRIGLAPTEGEKNSRRNEPIFAKGEKTPLKKTPWEGPPRKGRKRFQNAKHRSFRAGFSREWGKRDYRVERKKEDVPFPPRKKKGGGN